MTIEMVETNPTKIRWFSICKRLPEGNILLLCFVSEGYLLSCWSGSEPGWGSWGWVSTKIGCPWLPEIGEWSCSKTYFFSARWTSFFALPDVHHLFRHTQICGKNIATFMSSFRYSRKNPAPGSPRWPGCACDNVLTYEIYGSLEVWPEEFSIFLGDLSMILNLWSVGWSSKHLFSPGIFLQVAAAKVRQLSAVVSWGYKWIQLTNDGWLMTTGDFFFPVYWDYHHELWQSRS